MNNRTHGVLKKLFEHPMEGEVKWFAVEGMLHSLGADVEEREAFDEMRQSKEDRIILKGHNMNMTIPTNFVLKEGKDLQRLREFLTSCNVYPGHPEYEKLLNYESHGLEKTRLVVIDNEKSCIYNLEDNQGSVGIKMSDPYGLRKHLSQKHQQGNFQGQNFQGQRMSREPSYFKDIARHLHDCEQFALLSHGKGHSNAGNDFVNFMKRSDKELLAKYVANIRCDTNLTENEILAEARNFFGTEEQRNYPPVRHL